jgi:hypothetical protein
MLMKIVPFKVGTKWVVAVNPFLKPKPSRITDRRSETTGIPTAEGFWIEDGKRWFPQYVRAIKYDTAEEAQAFIQLHYEELSSTQILYPH